MLRLIIQTSSLNGTAAHHIPYLLEIIAADHILVVYSKNPISRNGKFFIRKVKKIIKIGICGALNGVRMRNWYKLSQEMNVLPIDEFCKINNVPFKITEKINSAKTKKLYHDFNPDLAVSLGNPYIASYIFSIPKFGMINLHHEILPNYQNAQSIIWQIFNGSVYTGYTIHELNKTIDGGAIMFKEKVLIKFNEKIKNTVIETNKNLLTASAKGLCKVLSDVENYRKNKTIQSIGKKYTTPGFFQFLKMKKQNRRLYNNKIKLHD